MRADDRRPGWLIAVFVAAVSLVGCGGAGAPTASDRAMTDTAAPTVTSASPAASSSASPTIEPQGVVLTEDDRGHIVTVDVGATITIVLHSTYWSPATTSTAAIVGPLTAGTVVPASPGTCLPGIGCGTVTTAFVAKAPGAATLSASRTVCGEALQCKDADRSWMVDVVVKP